MALESAPSQRSIAKATRRQTLLDAAARLFAQRGYAGVTIEEIGAAAGVSGPAVYRHFAGKQSILADMLVGVSEYLLDGAQSVLGEHARPDIALTALVDFQIDFALHNADVIRVQDRDLDSMAEVGRTRVRQLQRDYLQRWVSVLAALRPETNPAELRVMAHAAFGLINSTPFSLRVHGGKAASPTVAGAVLREMALAALS